MNSAELTYEPFRKILPDTTEQHEFVPDDSTVDINSGLCLQILWNT